ncbi:Protein SUPPRESSOR OF GENE SILENCING 3 [Bienertia sinuspersici]
MRPDNKHFTGPSVMHGGAKTGSSAVETEKDADEIGGRTNNESEEEEEEDAYSDDDDYLSGGSDSDEGPQTHESLKRTGMLKKFFVIFDSLSVEDLNDAERQWHCPACHGGPGAIDWYKGLQPLIAHARTKGSQRVKLHRTFANVLDEELRRRGTSAVSAGESFGQWEGLKQETKDHDIIWPPMVVIMNTVLDKDDNDKWLGMGNQELLDMFKGYAAVRAKHSYGPMGHRGFSVLIFESSAVGYLEAERLHKQFIGQGTGRSAWESPRRALFYPGGLRQLYGFLARKDDLDEFNRHCQGKSALKYEVRSYQEMVVGPIKQMSDDNQQLLWFKNKSAKDQRQKKALEESFNVVTEKLRQTMEQNRIVRQRTVMQHEENKEEMDFQEQFFKDQIQKIHDATNAKEDHFEKLLQEERKKIEDFRRRAEEVTKDKKLQEEEIEKFLAEREQLTEKHGEKRMEMKKKHWEEELSLEKEFDNALTELMKKYTPRPIDGPGNA